MTLQVKRHTGFKSSEFLHLPPDLCDNINRQHKVSKGDLFNEPARFVAGAGRAAYGGGPGAGRV